MHTQYGAPSDYYFGYGGNGGGARGGPDAGADRPNECKIFVRGLPFKVTGKEIEEFFAPLNCTDIRLGIGFDGRVTGDGMVEFASAQQAAQALAKDRQSIGTRYVEVS
jgi:RNA recognition motif-containing protein